jgi:hypothetical protein
METGRGHLGGPVEHSKWKGGESVVAILRFLCGSPRLCRLRTGGLAHVSKYWTYRSHASDMGPVSLVASHQLIHWLAQERNWVRTRGSVSRRAMNCVRSPFSWEQWPCSTLLMTTWKVAIRGPREVRMVDGHTRTERGKHVACWSGFPSRVYIDSNSHDSRIWVTSCSCLPSSSNLLD